MFRRKQFEIPVLLYLQLVFHDGGSSLNDSNHFRTEFTCVSTDFALMSFQTHLALLADQAIRTVPRGIQYSQGRANSTKIENKVHRVVSSRPSCSVLPFPAELIAGRLRLSSTLC